jgi:hypothetical protein
MSGKDSLFNTLQWFVRLPYYCAIDDFRKRVSHMLQAWDKPQAKAKCRGARSEGRSQGGGARRSIASSGADHIAFVGRCP